MQNFRLAPMSLPVGALTLGLLTLPVILLAGAVFAKSLLMVPMLFVVIVYCWVWLRFRPTGFTVRPGVVDITWPLKHRQIRRDDIAAARLVNRQELRRETGWCIRVGAGGLWGAFGWLWTERRGIVQMYVSRTDGLVWIECIGERPWLVTPEQPEAFVGALSAPSEGA